MRLYGDLIQKKINPAKSTKFNKALISERAKTNAPVPVKAKNPNFQNPIVRALLTAMNIHPDVVGSQIKMDGTHMLQMRANEKIQRYVEASPAFINDKKDIEDINLLTYTEDFLWIFTMSPCEFWFMDNGDFGIELHSLLPETVIVEATGKPLSTLIDIPAINHLNIAIKKITYDHKQKDRCDIDLEIVQP